MRVQTVTVTGVKTSNWLHVDSYIPETDIGVYVTPGAGATVSVELTPDDIFDPAVTPIAYPCNVASLTGATGSVSATISQPSRGIRLNQTVGASTSKLQVVTQSTV